ncbi:unnamed protein product [Mytilus coruscus]|uniref:Integrase p58-like C-terminal domain-containing protein n=1 Tax=Mytilus coruscus TaxID=42192 RepID=A0A6J8ASP3_MYTCO|nr:unnamed protein product [Mytilus coruscus]
MEEAHLEVRESIKENMMRQKKYHDQKLVWQTFKQGDQVFVFFPNVKTGTTSKLTSLWRGPFKIISKMSDVTYKVNCGRQKRPQVIHVDRMRKRSAQVLKGEKHEDIPGYRNVGVQVEHFTFETCEHVNDIGDNIDSIVEISNKETMSSKLSKPEEFSNHVPSSVSGRLRRKPQWMKDYVK